jgi:hypothetical protein
VQPGSSAKRQVAAKETNGCVKGFSDFLMTRKGYRIEPSDVYGRLSFFCLEPHRWASNRIKMKRASKASIINTGTAPAETTVFPGNVLFFRDCGMERANPAQERALLSEKLHRAPEDLYV